MTEQSREERVVQVLASLADTLVDDYDVVDLLQTLVDACSEILGVAEAGILLTDGDSGELETIASTSEATRLVEVMQLAAHAGPCIDCFRSGAPVSAPDIRVHHPGWESFERIALQSGFLAVDAIPMRLRNVTIGTLNLLRSAPGTLASSEATVARAFADVATIGILQERAIHRAGDLNSQLQAALDSRVVIEQAKGVVSQRTGLRIDEAYAPIRAYARAHQQPLHEVAAKIVRRDIDPSTLLIGLQGDA
ncbi:ANTAR domain-containing protein [Microbacterium sp. 179-B 1A2 NHS]|uniref:GAF and ANTAR domain-containing protein n=1 Tax=Microbacterium sp. 179-B 1A2 NHS TaxID=3142383 RepID=UPI0039A243F3